MLKCQKFEKTNRILLIYSVKARSVLKVLTALKYKSKWQENSNNDNDSQSLKKKRYRIWKTFNLPHGALCLNKTTEVQTDTITQVLKTEIGPGHWSSARLCALSNIFSCLFCFYKQNNISPFLLNGPVYRTELGHFGNLRPRRTKMN